jgi:hypothetical protein
MSTSIFTSNKFTVVRHLPLVNNDRTVLIIGGLQWLTEHHVNVTLHVLARSGQ